MLKLAIVGAGIMGERMLRAAREQAADTVELAGVWDRAPDALARIGAAVPGVPALASFEAAIAASDCVYIATPPAAHLDYAEQALAAGRAVFLEKPLAVDVGAAEAFTRRFAGERVAVNFPFASSFAVERIAGWMRDGVLGAPARLDIAVGFATWPRGWQHAAAGWLDGAAEGGFTREVVSHFLFLSRRLLGPIRLRRSSVVREGSASERSVEALLDVAGIRTTLSGAVGRTTVEDTNSWTLSGVGAIRLRDWSFAERQLPDGAWVADPDALPNARMRPLVLRRQLEQVALMTAGRPHALARVDEAFEVQSVVEAILRG